MSDDDDWGDEEVKEVPKVIMVGRVKQDYYPEKHHQLTLFDGAPFLTPFFLLFST